MTLTFIFILIQGKTLDIQSHKDNLAISELTTNNAVQQR